MQTLSRVLTNITGSSVILSKLNNGKTRLPRCVNLPILERLLPMYQAVYVKHSGFMRLRKNQIPDLIFRPFPNSLQEPSHFLPDNVIIGGLILKRPSEEPRTFSLPPFGLSSHRPQEATSPQATGTITTADVPLMID